MKRIFLMLPILGLLVLAGCLYFWAVNRGGPAGAGGIETNLRAVMSSPAYSSNPMDYIAAHRREYDEIVALGNDALDYCLAEFAGGSADGLRESVMAHICCDVLGERNPVPEGWASGRDWYEEYERTVGLRSMRRGNPAVILGHQLFVQFACFLCGRQAELSVEQ